MSLLWRNNPLRIGLGPDSIIVSGSRDAVHVQGEGAGDWRSALAALPEVLKSHRNVDAAVVLLGDMVHVGEAALAELVTRVCTSDAPLIVSRYGDVTAPPLLFRRALFAELLAWTGEGCGKTVVKAHSHEALCVDRPVALLADVDTPEDFEALRQSS